MGVGVGITGREPRMHARVDAKHAQANANAQMQASMNILSVWHAEQAKVRRIRGEAAVGNAK